MRQVIELLALCNEERVVVAGDFNATPEEEAINKMGGIFTNAYPGCKFTTVKLRPTGLVCHTIDYIWYKGMQLLNTEGLPELPPEYPYYPNQEHPSDHLKLSATFKI